MMKVGRRESSASLHPDLRKSTSALPWYLTRDGDLATGSARSVTGFDVYSAIKSCRDLLINFGGHTYACGLTMKWENVKEFRDRFHQYVAEHIAPEQTEAMLNIDADDRLQGHHEAAALRSEEVLTFGPCNQQTSILHHRTYMITAPARWWAESKSTSNWNW